MSSSSSNRFRIAISANRPFMKPPRPPGPPTVPVGLKLTLRRVSFRMPSPECRFLVRSSCSVNKLKLRYFCDHLTEVHKSRTIKQIRELPLLRNIFVGSFLLFLMQNGSNLKISGTKKMLKP